MIVINSADQIEDSEIAAKLGFEAVEEVESLHLDSVLNPDDGLIYIGKYKGNTIICTQDIPLEFLDQGVSRWETSLCQLFPDTEIASFVLHSVVNLWGYSVTKNNQKLRARAGSVESDFQLDEGKILEQEQYLFSLSEKDADGNRVYRFPDMPDDLFDDNQVGENFVFDLSKRYFGQGLDRNDELLETKMRGYKKVKRSSQPTTTHVSNHKILATKSVIDGNEINFIHKEHGIWILLSRAEYDEDKKYDEDSLFLVDEAYLYNRIPKLKGQLDQADKTTINVDYKTGETTINPQHFHFGIPTHDAKATRQVNAGFSLPYYLINTISRLKKPLFILLGFLIAAWVIGWFFYIPLVLYAAYQILVLAKTRDMYYSGALNPAIVIDAKTSKIASLTDLSFGRGSYPVIRVRNYPIPKKYRVNGTKIPVAGAYQNTEDYAHWNYYEPNPLPTGIKDDSIIEEKIRAIPTLEWIQLSNEVKKFNGIPKEGYYPIDIEKSSWKDMDLDAITWMQFGEEK